MKVTHTVHDSYGGTPTGDNFLAERDAEIQALSAHITGLRNALEMYSAKLRIAEYALKDIETYGTDLSTAPSIAVAKMYSAAYGARAEMEDLECN